MCVQSHCQYLRVTARLLSGLPTSGLRSRLPLTSDRPAIHGYRPCSISRWNLVCSYSSTKICNTCVLLASAAKVLGMARSVWEAALHAPARHRAWINSACYWSTCLPLALQNLIVCEKVKARIYFLNPWNWSRNLVVRRDDPPTIISVALHRHIGREVFQFWTLLLRLFEFPLRILRSLLSPLCNSLLTSFEHPFTSFELSFHTFWTPLSYSLNPPFTSFKHPFHWHLD